MIPESRADELIEKFGPELDVPKDWTQSAACAGRDVSLFYPLLDDSPPTLAKNICATCPVKLHCLAEAIRRNEHWGIWGGLSANDRAAVRKEFIAMKRRVA